MTEIPASTEASPIPVDWASPSDGVGFVRALAPPADAPLLKLAAKRRTEVMEFLTRAGDAQTALDADYVHDLRVAVRRLSEVAGLLTELMDKGSGRAVEESLKGLRKAAGELRDLDVAAEHLTKWRMPAAVKKIARDLVESQATRRPDLEKSLRDAATSASVTGTMVLLARVLEEQAKPERVADAALKLRRALQKRARKRRKQLKEAFGKAAQKQTPECLHEARIAAKKLRYVLELEKELDDKPTKKDLRFLKKIQELLGEHHDVHVIVDTVHNKMTEKHLGTEKSLHTAWRKWKRETDRAAKRAADFFVRSYEWMNAAAS